MKKTGILFLLAVLIFSGCGKENKKNTLTVGMELAYPPFEMTDTQGKPWGISVDLAYALGKFLNREVKIENMSFDGLIPSLKTGKIDVVISSMTITPERKKTVAFSDPYAKTYLALLLQKNSRIKAVEELNSTSIKVAVKKGTTGHLYARQHLSQAQILVFDKESACVLEVSQGKADVFIYDQMTIYENWKKNPQTTEAILAPFQTDPEAWGIALRQEDTELLNKVNDFLKEFRTAGGFDSLARKYLTEQKQTFDQLGIPFFF